MGGSVTKRGRITHVHSIIAAVVVCTVIAAIAVCTMHVLHANAENARERFFVGPDKAHKTVSSALDAMKAGDVCIISAGVYRECLDVRQDNVTLRGEGRVVITGCDRATGMQPCDIKGRKGLKAAVGMTVFDVFRGNQYLMPARYPDKTLPMTSNEDWEESVIDPDGRLGFRQNVEKLFPDLVDGYYVGLHGAFRPKRNRLSSWYSLTLPITGIDEQGFVEVNAERASSGFMGKYGQGQGLGYILGARAVLDAPGEWYSDGKQLLLIPPTDGAAGNYELRTRLYGAVVTGNGVRFENLRFHAATIRVEGNDVSLKKCNFEYISPFQHTPNPKGNRSIQSMDCCWGVPGNGTAGVFVQGNGFRAEDCRFSKSWWCGMMIRGNDAHIENCLFEDMNWMAKRCAGLFSWGDDNVVRFCTFRNLGGSGVEGGNAAWVKQYARRNVWEYNYIEDVCKLVVDQGFFYVNHQDGSNPKANSIWRYNVGKGSQGPTKGNWVRTTVGYYVDNSSSGYRVHNNIAIKANDAIRYNDTREGPRAGKDVWFYNNTFYKCGRIGFGKWNHREVAKLDAEVMLVNNIALPAGGLDFTRIGKQLKWKNNLQSMPASVLRNPDAMDFTPVDKKVKGGGIPVGDEPFKFIGAVDPQRGMWRYGADLSRLPEP